MNKKIIDYWNEELKSIHKNPTVIFIPGASAFKIVGRSGKKAVLRKVLYSLPKVDEEKGIKKKEEVGETRIEIPITHKLILSERIKINLKQSRKYDGNAGDGNGEIWLYAQNPENGLVTLPPMPYTTNAQREEYGKMTERLTTLEDSIQQAINDKNNWQIKATMAEDKYIESDRLNSELKKKFMIIERGNKKSLISLAETESQLELTNHNREIDEIQIKNLKEQNKSLMDSLTQRTNVIQELSMEINKIKANLRDIRDSNLTSEAILEKIETLGKEVDLKLKEKEEEIHKIPIEEVKEEVEEEGKE